jgi:hypothetical protein
MADIQYTDVRRKEEEERVALSEEPDLGFSSTEIA